MNLLMHGHIIETCIHSNEKERFVTNLEKATARDEHQAYTASILPNDYPEISQKEKRKVKKMDSITLEK